ncbi:hypothetical protein N0824_01003 [Microcystis sp. 0824]|nr:hypothetical protein N0824_01003 [Microcystis sp. 0824]
MCIDNCRENCFGPRYLYCTHQIAKTQTREFSVISKGCGVWGVGCGVWGVGFGV